MSNVFFFIKVRNGALLNINPIKYKLLLTSLRNQIKYLLPYLDTSMRA